MDGYAAAHGQDDLESLPLARFCHLVWWWIIRNAESEADVDRVKEQIWRPPAGEAGEGIWSAEAETEAFEAAMKALGG